MQLTASVAKSGTVCKHTKGEGGTDWNEGTLKQAHLFVVDLSLES